jgi:outer membrane lipoprotein-sorting protein
MNRRNLLLATPLLLLPELALGQALSNAEQSSVIAAVGRAVNAITRLQGRFIQTNPDSTTIGGRFWLQRPGKVRFEYDAPSPLLLISDGTNVILRDTRLRTTDRYPLRQTPLYFLLKANVDLARDVIVTGVERRGGNHLLAMRDRRREADGELTVSFDQATSALEEWTIRDRQGRTTRVRLVNSAPASSINPTLFVDPSPNRRMKTGN